MKVWRWSFFGGIMIFTLLAGSVSVYLYDVPKQQAEQGAWITHTYEVMNQLEVLSGELTIHAGDDSHTREDIQKTLSNIESLTSDNPNQQIRIPVLRQSIASLFVLSQDTSLSAEDKNKKRAISKQINAMLQEEKRLLEERNIRWHATIQHTQLWFISGTLMLYVLTLFSYIAIRNEARSRERLFKLESETAAMHRGIAARMMQIIEIQKDIVGKRLSLDSAMDIITERTQSITRADGAVVEMLQGDGMFYRAASGSLVPFIGFKIQTQGSMSGLCVASANALRCDDSETDDRVNKEACRKVNIRSMIVVPLMQEEKAVGVLKVASSQPNTFAAEDVSTLQLMAGVLSATLRDAMESEMLHDSNKSLSVSNAILQAEKALLESEKSELKTRADTDGMTGLKNHRYFQEYLTREYQRARRYGNELSFILLDIDHFKKFNDDFGHPARDEVIKQVAEVLKTCMRPSDCVARYGGEEYAVVLPQTPLEGALETAERIRQTITDTTWEHRAVTVSIGVSSLTENTQDALSLINQADKALYQSKMNGRDRITSFAA